MTTIVTCDDCGQKNRLPLLPPPSGKKVVCGRCKAELPDEEFCEDCQQHKPCQCDEDEVADIEGGQD